MADMRIALGSGALDAASRSSAPGSAPALALAAASRDCGAAAEAFTSLHDAREAVVSARVDALQAKDAELAGQRESLRAEMAARKAKADASFVAALRPLASVYSS